MDVAALIQLANHVCKAVRSAELAGGISGEGNPEEPDDVDVSEEVDENETF
jgi:hypothetical protein